MKHWSLSATTAMTLILSAGASFAVTPEEVWANWKGLVGESGGTLTTQSETRTGAALEVTGLRSVATTPEGDEISVALARLTLTDRGDGSVAVTLSDSYDVTVAKQGGNAETPSAVIAITQPGTEIIASGTPQAVKYDFTAPKVNVALKEAHKADGTPIILTLSGDVYEVTGSYLVAPNDKGGFGVDATLTTGAIKVMGAGEGGGEENAADKGVFNLAANIAGFTSVYKGNLLDAALMKDMGKAFAAGFFMDGTSEVGATDFSFDLTENGTKTDASGKLDALKLRAKMTADQIDYGFDLAGLKAAMNAPNAGLTSGSTAFDQLSFAAAMPVGVSDDAKDFTFLTRLGNLTLSESIWALFDPTAQLPRDPANLVVDLKGKAAWLQDVFVSEPAPPAAPGQLPARLDSLDVAEISANVAGAEAKANGALTFDNADLQTFGGFPAPNGKITVNLAGLSTLLEKLVAMGIVPADQLTGMRMGLAMFTRPGSGPDSLVSEIEFKEKGLFVNGQRIM